jgi:hypothetical protein
MRVNFHPSSLLSIGDLLAFVKEVSATASGTSSQQQAVQQPELLPAGVQVEDWRGSFAAGRGSSSAAAVPASAPRASAVATGPVNPQDTLRWRQLQQQQVLSRRPQVEAVPSIEQQMALAEGVTSRIPQRYEWLLLHVV